MPSFEEDLLEDIISNDRGFLPGTPRTRDEIREAVRSPVLYDGLSIEEAQLLVSALPRACDQIWVQAMDKGLSGATVLLARYELDGMTTKKYVAKIGDARRLSREMDAISELVVPFVPGATRALFRESQGRAVLIQELAGLAADTDLLSLRNFARESVSGSEAVDRLFLNRLTSWYRPSPRPDEHPHVLGELFKPYLDKGVPDRPDPLPADWVDLSGWVLDSTGIRWTDVPEISAAVELTEFYGLQTVVHGDLHSQNLVVEPTTREIWPIDFGWTRRASNPIVDLTMLETSLKFKSMPIQADLVTFLNAEVLLSREPIPTISIGSVPYGDEIRNVYDTVLAVRRVAMEELGYSFEIYRKGLWLMEYSHTSNRGLNSAALLGGIQVLSPEVV